MKIFRYSTKQMRVRNRITRLLDRKGEWKDSEEELEGIVVSYFSDLFSYSVREDFSGVIDNLQPKITEAMNNSLTSEVTENEIKHSLFVVHPEKSPGLDGMTILFYQQY